MNIKKFYQTVRRLKDIKRIGFVERGVKNSENVSDHCLMVAILCMIFPSEGVDKVKIIKMALIHDLAESKTGDAINRKFFSKIPSGWEKHTVCKKEKVRKERKIIKKIVSMLTKDSSKEIMELWNEYEERKTKEALFVKDMDVLERTFQALDYDSKRNYKKSLKVFWNNKNLSEIKSKEVRKFLEGVIREGW